jgi:16S rRNA (guanine1207-N2)-methyltransferase
MSGTSSEPAASAGRCLIGATARAGPGDLVIALTDDQVAAGQATAATTMPFHEAAGASTPRAGGGTSALPRAGGGAVVGVPERRGYSFLAALCWLLGRTVVAGSEVVWEVGRHPAPRTVGKRLAELGWELEATRSGRMAELVGPMPPDLGAEPRPRHFRARLGRAELRLEADYGAFSRDDVDPGTRLLVDTALTRLPEHPQLVDVGAGCGPIALALLANGWAGRATATDVDSVALWLAARNARANGLEVQLALGHRPPAVGPGTAVTCNFPTHAERQRSDRLLADLVASARMATVAIVVHASLEDRFRRRVAAAGGDTQRLAVAGHAVLRLSS